MNRGIVTSGPDGPDIAGENTCQGEAEGTPQFHSSQGAGTRTEWLSWATAVVVVGVIVNACMPSSMAPSSSAQIYSSTTALTVCQMALKQASRDPETADIPYVADQGSGNTYHFAWGAHTAMTRVRNDSGLEVSTQASCTVDKSRGRITSLALDGKSIF